MLSDVEIRAALAQGEIVIYPPPVDSDIQPASIDVHLGSRIGILLQPISEIATRLTEPSNISYQEIIEFVLIPKAFILAQLAERVTLSSGIVARIEGKSSIGRKGVAIHVTAGFVDPGWDGILTLEIYNASNIPYILRPGDPIGQLAFDRLVIPSERPYGHKDLGSHFQGSDEVKGS